jgi:hypothetical protein
LRGRRKSFVRIDALLKIDNYFIGFECKESVSHLSRIDDDERIAYINNLSAVYLACYSDEKTRAWKYWFEKHYFEVFEKFGLIIYDPFSGNLNVLKSPKKVEERVIEKIGWAEEDRLKYTVWKMLRNKKYTVISEVEASRQYEPIIMIRSGDKHLTPYSQRVSKIPRIDFIAIPPEEEKIIGVEVKLSPTGKVIEQLGKYLESEYFDELRLAVPKNLGEKAIVCF